MSIETGDGVAPGAGVAAGTNDGPGSLGTAKGVDCGSGVAPGDGATDGVFAGAGDWLDGVVDRGEVGGGVCASRDPPNQVSATSEMSRRTSIFAVDLFCIIRPRPRSIRRLTLMED